MKHKLEDIVRVGPELVKQFDLGGSFGTVIELLPHPCAGRQYAYNVQFPTRQACMDDSELVEIG